jgi:hypothetical protein
MQGQLDAMETDQRPWIQPKMQLVGFRFTKDSDAELTYFLGHLEKYSLEAGRSAIEVAAGPV